MFDLFRGRVEINYNRLPAQVGARIQDEAGWSEDYFFPTTPGVDVIRQNMRNLVAARASLLPQGCYIFRTSFGQASVFKSQFSLNGSAINPVPTFTESWTNVVTECNDIEAGPIYRFENGAGRRWQRIVTAFRDEWMKGMTTLYGAYSYDPISGLAAPQVATFGGVQATGTATVSGGGVNAVTITGGGGPYAIAPRVFFVGGDNNAYATAVLTAGAVTGVTGINAGTGYGSAPTVFIPAPQSEAWGLMAGQDPTTYIDNYISCVAKYCINFRSVRVANASFPSGFMTQGDTVPSGGTAGYVATRAMFQRVSDRDRGRIHVTNTGRRKRAI